MGLTVSEIGRHLRHSLRGEPSFSDVEIANAAGPTLCNAWSWNWLANRVVSLDVTAGSEYVDLPDSRRIIDIQVKDGPTYRSLSGRSLINALRQGTSLSVYGYDIALSYRQVTGGKPVRILEFFPAPAEDQTGLFKVWYDAEWQRVVDDNAEVSIPTWLEPLFLEFCRAFAHGWQFPETGTPDALITRIKSGEMWMDAIQTDGELMGPSGGLLPVTVVPKPSDPLLTVRRNITNG